MRMPESRLYAAVLAAGRATRFGSPKQLAIHAGLPLVAAAVRRAEAVCGRRTLLVTGHAGSAVHAACAPLRGFLVHNDGYADGIASSIRAAVAALPAHADGLMITLADQPLIATGDLQRLAAAWQATPLVPAACDYAGTTGVPAVFPRRAFADLAGLKGDEGARKVLLKWGDDISRIRCDAAATDIDRPADLESL